MLIDQALNFHLNASICSKIEGLILANKELAYTEADQILLSKVLNFFVR